MSMHYVFVYGTLKKGYPNHYVLNDENKGIAKFIFEGKTKDKYPVVIATTSSIPFLLNKKGQGVNFPGEIYKVDDNMLNSLDKFENHPGLYTRTEIEITAEDKIISCGAYILFDFQPKLLELEFLDSYLFSDNYVPPGKRTHSDVLSEVKNK